MVQNIRTRPTEGASWTDYGNDVDLALRETQGLASSPALTMQPLPLVGEFVGNRHNGTTDTAFDSDGVVFFIPFVLPPGTYDAVRVNIRTAGGAGATYRCGLYSDAAGTLGSLLAQTSGTDATVTGSVVSTLSASIVVGSAGRLVWGGITQQGGASTRAQVRRITSAYWPNQVYMSSTDETQQFTAGLRASGVTASFPTTLSTTRSDSATGGMTMHFRRSA